MERSSSSNATAGDGQAGPLAGRRPPRAGRFIVQLDRAVLVALATGLVLYVMPFWAEGRLRAAFWVTLAATVVHIYTSHQRAAAAAPGPVVVDTPKEAS